MADKIKKGGWTNIGNSLPFTIPSGYTELYIYGQIKVGSSTGRRLGAIMPANTPNTLRQEAAYYVSNSDYAVWPIVITSAGEIQNTSPIICGQTYTYTDAFSYINIMAR